MTLVWGCRCPCKKWPSVTFFDSFLSLELGDKLFDQLIGHPGANLPIAIILSIAFLVPKHIKKDLQRIFKIVLEVQASTTSKKSQDKFLKARFPNMYHDKSHMKCYNFYQQSRDYFVIARNKDVNQIFFIMFIFWDQISFRL